MNFKSVQIRNFRNIHDLNISLEPGFNLFLGENGQGKTNFIEALYFSLNGSSFRTSNIENLLNRENQESRINAIVWRGLLEDSIETRLKSNRREFSINGKKTSSLKLRELFPTVLFSPESLTAIKEGPERRRDLIDEVIENSSEFGPHYVDDYRKALRTRNQILRNYAVHPANLKQTQGVLEALNVNFLRFATLLTRARLELIAELNKTLKDVYSAITNQNHVDISVEYVISDQNANKWDIETVYNAMSKRMSELTSAELSQGTSLIGPHKHDIRFIYNGNNSRFYCSQGQQRALILAFKINQIVYHRRAHDVSPILFLDDVLSELDSGKREYLLRFLRDHDSQTFITTTDLAQAEQCLGEFVSNSSEIFEVNQGRIKRRIQKRTGN